MSGMLEKPWSQSDWQGARWEDKVREEVRLAVPLGADSHRVLWEPGAGQGRLAYV